LVGSSFEGHFFELLGGWHMAFSTKFSQLLIVIATFLYPGGALTESEPGAISALTGNWQAFGGISFGCNDQVLAVERSADGLIYLAGAFSDCDGVAANGVVAYDPATNRFLPLISGQHNGVDGQVNALAISGDQVYLGGYFTEAGGQQVNRLARWDGDRWHSLGNGVNEPIWALAISGNDLYVGGWFTEAGGKPANHVARWDGDTWHSLGESGAIGVNDFVHALAVDEIGLVVGGYFSRAGDKAASRIARWDGYGWQGLGEGVSHSNVALISALAISDGNIYAGGQFDQAGDVQANNLARWDGNHWTALGNSDDITGNGVDGGVTTLAAANNHVVVGGDFTRAGSIGVRHLAHWDGRQWHALGPAEFRSVDSPVQSLAIMDNELYVGGQFHLAGGEIANHIARWDGKVWGRWVKAVRTA